MAAFLLGTFFAAMAAAGYVIELVFGGLGLVPGRAAATIPVGGVFWDYTTWLNIVFLILAGALVLRFARTGGGMTLKMMGGAPEPAGAGGGHAATPAAACTAWTRWMRAAGTKVMPIRVRRPENTLPGYGKFIGDWREACTGTAGHRRGCGRPGRGRRLPASPGSTPMRKTRIRWRRHFPSRCCEFP